ncbi:MAG: hypothetical protein HKN23_15275 [Verrucomicrobiales bacterium]|nr:hypothetical protein [Verrucomicrobiales bacterium]
MNRVVRKMKQQGWFDEQTLLVRESPHGRISMWISIMDFASRQSDGFFE